MNDKAANYRHFLERLFGDLDIAVEKIDCQQTLDSIVQTAGWKLELVDTIRFNVGGPPMPVSSPEHGQMLGGSYYGMQGGGYEIFEDHTARIARTTYDEFDKLQRAIHAKSQIA
ncbi:MAG TPA: hypothetical protein VJ783_32370 [Pirellulales bacterium]|nr:hypothetical protein [Pirellulales bacterium]